MALSKGEGDCFLPDPQLSLLFLVKTKKKLDSLWIAVSWWCLSGAGVRNLFSVLSVVWMETQIKGFGKHSFSLFGQVSRLPELCTLHEIGPLVVFTLCVLMAFLPEDKTFLVKITCHSIKTFCLGDAVVSKHFSARACSPVSLHFFCLLTFTCLFLFLKTFCVIFTFASVNGYC